MGPRTDEELPSGSQLKMLLNRVGNTLECRKVEGKNERGTITSALHVDHTIFPSFCLSLTSVVNSCVRADAAELHCAACLQTR